MTRTFEIYAARMPMWVLLGAVFGIACGVFFGDLTAPLDAVNRVYTAMMQVAAIPYLISSILHGLASISREHFGRVLRQAGLAYALVLALTFSLLAVITIAITDTTAPALVVVGESDAASGLIDRIIPTNIFSAAAQNYLPATIVFSFLFGVALQKAKKTGAILDSLAAIKTASVLIWQWVVLFAPVAVFSVMAHLAGTTPLDSLETVSTYFIAVVLGALVLAFVILPAVLNAFYPRAMGHMWPELRNGLLIAMTTSLSVAALPFVQRAVNRFLDAAKAPSEQRSAVTETTLSLSYPLAQLGNFFVWIFIAFAFTYYRETVTPVEQLLLPLMVLLSAIGSPSTSVDAVAFLTDWLRLPAEAVDLYSGTFVVTRYAQVLASVMGFAFVTALTALLYYRLSQISAVRLSARLGAVLMIVAAVGFAVSLPTVSAPRKSYATI